MEEDTSLQNEQAGQYRLAEVAGLFLRLGFTAFGGPAAHIAMMRQEVVQRRKWISDEKFVDLMGIVNLVPGPNSTEMAIYLGYMRAGWPGLLLAGLCFIVPAMLIVLALAWLYVSYGTLPQVDWLLDGIKPVVIAIIAYALVGLSRTVLKGVFPVIFALLVLVLYMLGINEILLLLGGGVLFGLIRLLKPRRKDETLGVLALPFSLEHLHAVGQKLSLPSVVVGAVMTTSTKLLILFLTFLKIGALLYGGGYVLLAFLQRDFVEGLGWLSEQQLLDAVSIGQFTPGPLFTTATFIGYLVGSWPGAILATLGIFLPSFLFVAVVHPFADRLRQFSWTSALLDGVNIAAVALMGGVLLQLGSSFLLQGPFWGWGIALVSFVVLLRYQINSAWLVLGGALIGSLLSWLF